MKTTEARLAVFFLVSVRSDSRDAGDGEVQRTLAASGESGL
jgi:hypothetical protein